MGDVSKHRDASGWPWATLIAWLMFCSGCSLPYPVNDTRHAFNVIEARLTSTGQTCLVDAGLDYRFSQPVIEAMEQGVPLTLVIRFSLVEPRDYWPDQTLIAVSRRLHVSYHPLTRSYRIVYPDTGVMEHFATLTTLIEYLGALRDWQIPAVCTLQTGHHYTARLGVTLDIESLPLPLRPLAYLSPDWHLQSPLYPWLVAG